MSDKKQDANIDVMLADVMLRITAMEKLLISKGTFTQEELVNLTEEIAKKVAKGILEKMQSSKDIEDFVKKLESSASSQTPENKNFTKN